MKRHAVPAGGGRGVLVRAGAEGDCVQLALLSVHGNVLESVTLDRAQLPGVVGALRAAQAEADRIQQSELARRRRATDARHAAALVRNPWLNGRNAHLVNATYIGREDVSHET
jgi:hypothetical protein